MKFLYTLLLCLSSFYSFSQDFYDLNTIQTIEIEFAETNWDQLLDNAYASTGDYILATSVTINGIEYDSVGVKYKGNSTYNPNQTKNPFHIELDTYKDHQHEDYTDIKLSNVAKDPSFLREVLSYQILRQYMHAPLSNYANVYVNGDLIGLYSNSESISKKFVNSRFYSKKNTFVKCNPPDGAGPGASDFPNLEYLGEDSLNYYDAYEIKSDEGWDELIDLCDTLNNHTDDIEKILDVDRALWMLAFNNVVVNLDSYIGGFKQNYYLYRDETDRFSSIIWDLNESFGRFTMTGSGNLNSTAAKQQMDHLLHDTDSNFPLIQKLLSVPTYKRMYLAHCKTILKENFENGSYFETGQSLQDLVKQAVQADDNKFFTYNNFIDNLTSDVNSGGGGPGGGNTVGIKNLMDGRANYLLSLNDFTQTQPTISNIMLSDENPLINQSIAITATIENANTVIIGYRSSVEDAFIRTPMLDDGNNNDGVANDGIYGITINLTNAYTQYYIYAENNNIGMFSPQRAEHEYHTILATNVDPDLSDVVINEFMASNNSSQADQDGEYDDWIELYNNSSNTIDLSGYTLSDDYEELDQWEFPAGTTIGANGYLIVWADKDYEQSGLHANFKLSAASESIFLSDDSGAVIDEVSYIDQMEDVSFGRYPNGNGPFQFMSPTFNAQNVGTSSSGDIDFWMVEMQIFPNPVRDRLTIISKHDLLLIQLFDMSGRLIQELHPNQRQINVDMSDFENGMYIIRASAKEDKSILSRIVLQK